MPKVDEASRRNEIVQIYINKPQLTKTLRDHVGNVNGVSHSKVFSVVYVCKYSCVKVKPFGT